MKKINEQYQFLNGVTIWLDFDGIISGSMFYTKKGKTIKGAQYGARHALEMLAEFGAEIHIITGDSTSTGQAIAEKIAEKLPIVDFHVVPNIEKAIYIAENYGITSRTYYAADDIFDIVNAKWLRTIVPNNAHHSLMKKAFSVSLYEANDYFIIDLASIIVKTEIKETLLRSNTDHSIMEKMLDVDNDVFASLLNIYTCQHLFSTFTIDRVIKQLPMGRGIIAESISSSAFIKHIVDSDSVRINTYIKDFYTC